MSDERVSDFKRTREEDLRRDFTDLWNPVKVQKMHQDEYVISFILIMVDGPDTYNQEETSFILYLDSPIFFDEIIQRALSNLELEYDLDFASYYREDFLNGNAQFDHALDIRSQIEGNRVNIDTVLHYC